MSLLEELDVLGTLVENRLGDGIEVGSELGKRREFTVLSLVEFQRTCHLLHCLRLRVTTHTAHGDADVDGRSYTRVEEVGLEEYLAVGNGNHIGWDIGRDVASLSLDNRQCGEGSTSLDDRLHRIRQVVHGACHVVAGDDLGSAFEQTAMEVEDITRVCLTPWWASEDKRDLTVGDRLFGEVVIDHERVTARIAEILTDSSTGIRCVVLHGGRVGRRSGNDDGIVHGTVFLERAYEVSHGRGLLSYCDIDTIDRVAVLEILLLVDNGIDRDCRLTCLTVADDQLTLSTSDRDLRVDSLETCLKRLVDGLAEDNSRCLSFERHLVELPLYRSLSVDWVAERIDDASEQSLACHDRGDTSCTLDAESLLDFLGRSEEHGTYVIFLKIEHDTHHPILELDELVGLHIVESVDAGHAVTHLQNLTYLLQFRSILHAIELLFEDVEHLTWFDIGHSFILFDYDFIFLSNDSLFRATAYAHWRRVGNY